MRHIGKLNTLGVEFGVIIFRVEIESECASQAMRFIRKSQRGFLFHGKHGRLSRDECQGYARQSARPNGPSDAVLTLFWIRHSRERLFPSMVGAPSRNEWLGSFTGLAGRGAHLTQAGQRNPGTVQRLSRKLTTSRETLANPSTPSARAAAGVRSMMRPSTNGPRWLIRTSVFCPVRLFVTSTIVLSGSVR